MLVAHNARSGRKKSAEQNNNRECEMRESSNFQSEPKKVTSVLQHTNLYEIEFLFSFSLDKFQKMGKHPLLLDKSSTEIDSLHTNNLIFSARKWL